MKTILSNKKIKSKSTRWAVLIYVFIILLFGSILIKDFAAVTLCFFGLIFFNIERRYWDTKYTILNSVKLKNIKRKLEQ